MYNEESQLVDDFCSLIEQDSSPWEIEKYGKDRFAGPSVRYFKFIKGFSVIGYGYRKI